MSRQRKKRRSKSAAPKRAVESGPQKRSLEAAAAPERVTAGSSSFWGLCALIVALSLALYWPTGAHGPVSFDDPAYVTENPRVLGGLGASGFVWAFTESHSNNWHPLTWITHMIDVELFGTGYGRHHLVSALWHGVAAAFLFAWWGIATGRWGHAFFVAGFFVVHPLNVESVAWLAERKSTLSAAFFFATLTVWSLRAHRLSEGRSARGLYAAALVLGAGGLMSKPMIVTLPFVLLLVDLWPLARWRVWPGPLDDEVSDLPGAELSLREVLLDKVPFFALTAGSIVATLLAQREVMQSVETFGLGERLSNAVASYFRYPLAIAWPEDLAIFYPFAPVAPAFAVSLAALLLALTVGALMLRGRAPWLLFGWLWYLGLLVPVIGLVQVGLQGWADRYAYLPMVGLVVAATFWWRPSGAARTVTGALACALLILLGGLTRAQIAVWKDDFSLYGHAAATRPSFWAHYNLGLLQQRAGQRESAVASFEAALALEPDSVETLRNLGLLQRSTGRAQEGLERLAEAVRLRPSDRFAAFDLARALFEDSRYDDAEALLQGLVEDRAEDARAWSLLGSSRVRQGKLEEAEEALRRAVALDDGDAISQNALGVSLAQRGRFAEAVPFFERALALDPQHREAAENLRAATALAEGRSP